MKPESSFATAMDLMEEVTSFFVRFEQVESNDLDPWIFGVSVLLMWTFMGTKCPKIA